MKLLILKFFILVGCACAQEVTQRQLCQSGQVWNGDRCECYPGFVLKGNECVAATSIVSCPPGTRQLGENCIKENISCPSGFEVDSTGFCSRTSNECPDGTVLINEECLITNDSCPDGAFGNKCDIFPMNKTLAFNCPPGTFLNGSKCDKLPKMESHKQHPIAEQPPTCPLGFYKIGSHCFPIPQEGATSARTITCPQGAYRIGLKCFQRKLSSLSRKPTCPDGFAYNNNLCYRCPKNYNLCGVKCLQKSVACNKGVYQLLQNVHINFHIHDDDGTRHNTHEPYSKGGTKRQ